MSGVFPPTFLFAVAVQIPSSIILKSPAYFHHHRNTCGCDQFWSAADSPFVPAANQALLSVSWRDDRVRGQRWKLPKESSSAFKPASSSQRNEPPCLLPSLFHLQLLCMLKCRVTEEKPCRSIGRSQHPSTYCISHPLLSISVSKMEFRLTLKFFIMVKSTYQWICHLNHH